MCKLTSLVFIEHLLSARAHLPQVPKLIRIPDVGGCLRLIKAISHVLLPLICSGTCEVVLPILQMGKGRPREGQGLGQVVQVWPHTVTRGCPGDEGRVARGALGTCWELDPWVPSRAQGQGWGGRRRLYGG